MRATLTFNNVYDTDVELTGSSGHDLARANRLTKVAPPSFIVTTSVFNAYLDSGISEKIKQLAHSGSFDYQKLKALFSKAHLSNELLSELKESYESLNIGGESSLLSDGEPTVNLFLSPDYFYDYDYSKNIILNVSGFKNFIDALKSMWLRLYSKENIEYRKKNGVEFFSTAVIVQKAQKTDVTIEVSAKGNMFHCQAYKGLPDLTRSISKDKAVCEFSNITDIKIDVASQEFKIVPDEKSSSLLKIYLKDKALDQKISTSLLSEVARISKKIKYGFSSNINALFSVHKDRIWLLYVQTIPGIDFDVEEEDQTEVEVATLAEVPTTHKSVEVEEPVFEFNFDKEESLEVEDVQPEDISLEETHQDAQDELDEDFDNDDDLEEDSDDEDELVEDTEDLTDELSFEEDLAETEEKPEEKDEFLLHDDHIEEQKQDLDEEESIFESKSYDLDEEATSESTKESYNYVELENKLDVTIAKLYRESYGFNPVDYTKALSELNVKYSINDLDDLIDFKNLIKRREQGNSIDEELLSRCADSVKGFIEDNADFN